MKYTYADGCTWLTTNVDNKELADMTLAEAKSHVIKLIEHMGDMDEIQEMFKNALSILGVFKAYDRCEQCGDIPFEYTLEIDRNNS